MAEIRRMFFNKNGSNQPTKIPDPSVQSGKKTPFSLLPILRSRLITKHHSTRGTTSSHHTPQNPHHLQEPPNALPSFCAQPQPSLTTIESSPKLSFTITKRSKAHLHLLPLPHPKQWSLVLSITISLSLSLCSSYIQIKIYWMKTLSPFTRFRSRRRWWIWQLGWQLVVWCNREGRW